MMLNIIFTYWFTSRCWTLPLLGLCYCLCCHEGLAATVSVQQATPVAELNKQSRTETWQTNQSLPEGMDSVFSKPNISQLHGSLDIYNNHTQTQRSTLTTTSAKSTVSSQSPLASEEFSSPSQVDETLRSDTVSVSKSQVETLTSFDDKLFINVSSPTNVSSTGIPSVTHVVSTTVVSASNVVSTPNVASVTNVSTTNVASVTNVSTTNVTSVSNVSTTNVASVANVSTTNVAANTTFESTTNVVSFPNVSSTNIVSNSNVSMSNASLTDMVSSSNDHWLRGSVTPSLTSQLSVDDNDTVTLNPMSVLDTQGLVTETDNEDVSPEARPTSKREHPVGNGALSPFSAVTSTAVTSTAVTGNTTTTPLQTVESHSPAEVLTSPPSNVLVTSIKIEIATSVAIAMTSSTSQAVFHPDIDVPSRSTAVPVTMDANAITTETEISLANTLSMETTTQGMTTPYTTRSTVLTSRKPPTTISILDKFTKHPKTRLQIKIADTEPPRVAAAPPEKPLSSTKYPAKNPDGPPMKQTMPTVAMTTPSPTPKLLLLYVTLVMKTSWSEFCTNFQEFQTIIAKLLVIKNRNISANQVRLLESDQCARRTARSVQITVGVYIVNPKGVYDFDMNNALAKQMQDDQIRRLTGTMFENKILYFKIHGKVIGQDVASESPDRPPDQMDRGIVIAIGISCLAGVCVIGLIIVQVVYVKRRRGIKRMRKSFRDRCSVDIRSIAESIQLGEVHGRRGARFVYDNPALNWCETKDYTSNVLDTEGLSRMTDDPDTIEDEFLLLPSKMPKLSDVPLGAEDKNRYANVIPNPETRVSLSVRKGEDNSDYINANYLRGYLSSPQGYIATQAPLEGTCADFWRMAWEQRCQIVIMLTGLEEHGLSKCAEYWPNTDGGDVVRIYGDYEITQQRRQVKTEWIMSVITLRDMKTNQCHEIRHFWMTAWPVNGLPDARTVIHFLLALRPHLEETTVPPIIHCSPGTGRTGTLLAIDLGMLSYDDTKMVDILASVYRMRQDRGGMVQTREQYEYIYRVLYEYVQMAAPDT